MTQISKSGSLLSNDQYALLKSLAGKKAALLTADLLSEEAKLRFRSFYPCGDMLIGLRYREAAADKAGFKFGRALKIMDGKIVEEPRGDVTFTAPLIPHHAEHVYGFWHINEEQEMYVNLKLADDRAVTILIEGFPQAGRKDRFAWYCLKCLNPLYMGEVETARVGLGGYYAAQEDAFNVFNADEKVRTCKECGTVHPVAYSIFPWKDDAVEKAARNLW